MSYFKNIEFDMNKKILFISHEASRTGATIVLLHLLKWIKSNTDINFEIVLKKSGVLLPEFQELAPVTVFASKSSIFMESIQKFLSQYGIHIPLVGLRRNLKIKRIFGNNIDLIYSNTITNLNILEMIDHLDCPIICHVHELEWGINFYGLKRFNRLIQLTNRFIAVSKSVKENLIKNHGISEKSIDLHYEFIPTMKFELVKNREQIRKDVCIELGFPEDANIICSSGTTGWRKGPDLFIEMALIVRKLKPEMPSYFMWVGGENNGQRYNDLTYDIKKAGLEDYIKFIGEKSNPIKYYSACDLFVLTSREDPFPLVCLESATLGKPIICFDKAGGMKEFVEKDAGFVVPYLDTHAMAKKVIDIFQRPQLKEQMGMKAREKVRNRHDIEIEAPRILNTISKTMA